MSNKEKRNRYSNILIYVGIVLLLVAVVLLVLFFLSNGNETVVKSDYKDEDSSSLKCVAKDQKDAFFQPKGTEDYSHEIKILFDKDKPTNFSYMLTATYGSKDEATAENARMDAEYGIYITDRGGEIQTLNPVFSPIDNIVRISLYAERKKLNLINSELFFLNGDDYNKMGHYSAKEMKELYKSKGFSCEYHE